MIITHSTPNRIQRANDFRDRKLEAGYLWGTHVFQIDSTSQGMITGRASKILSVKSRGEVCPDFFWRAMDDSLVLFTQDEFLAFAEEVDDYVESVYQESWQLKDGT